MQTFAEKALAKNKTELDGKPVMMVVLSFSLVLFFGVVFWILVASRAADWDSNPKHFPQRVAATAIVAPSDYPPNSLTIDGKRWVVQDSNKNKGGSIWPYSGWTDCSTRTIIYDFSGNTMEQKRDTLWHEIGHAFRCDHPKSEIHIPNTPVNMSLEHKSVYDLGMSLAPFVHDNPEFMDWAMHWKEK